MTLVPFLAALALVALGAAPFVGPFALTAFLAALGLWIRWKAVTNILGLRSENVFRLAETSELLGRGGPDDPDFILMPRRPHGVEEAAANHEDAVARVSSADREEGST